MTIATPIYSTEDAKRLKYVSDALTQTPWTLKQLRNHEVGLLGHGLTVFSCFSCGGGSSLGYKLAGYRVLGGCEIDKRIAERYIANLAPEFFFTMGVQTFNKIKPHQLPPELFKLDILDGSPPCSSFSLAGDREDKWNVKKKFREGQAEQVLDDLFQEFLQTARKLGPKVVVAENVKGLIQGNARGYVKEIFKRLDAEGYTAQLFLLNSSRMGVAQRRERTFFVARLKSLDLPDLVLQFDEPERTAFEVTDGALDGFIASKANLRRSEAGERPLWDTRTCPAQTATASGIYFRPRELNQWKVIGKSESLRLQGFPDDYDTGKVSAQFITGMSVPPLMMQRLAAEIKRQWFSVPSVRAVP